MDRGVQPRYPERQRNFPTLYSTGVQLGFDAGFDVLKEFYPELPRKLFNKKPKPQAGRMPVSR